MDLSKVKVRAMSIENIQHPEWGTWGVMEDRGDWYEIHARQGSRVLFKDEAIKYWRIVNGRERIR